MPESNVVKRAASGKKGKLSCCKCLLDQIKANLAEIQPSKPPKCQKSAFLTKRSVSQWVNIICNILLYDIIALLNFALFLKMYKLIISY